MEEADRGKTISQFQVFVHVMMDLRQFGGRVTPELQRQYARSANWRNGSFKNLELTTMGISLKNLPGLIYKQISSKGRRPKLPLKVKSFDKSEFLAETAGPKYAWYGHSAVLLRLNGMNIFVDPMMGPNASPPAPFQTKRFSDNTLGIIDDLPQIDLVLLTHDHYDHLDKASILRLKGKVKQFFTALGVKRHLISWGIDPSIVREFDWWGEADFGGIDITFTPSRHFSGRGLRDRNKSLWGGWALRSSSGNIFISGDGGYGSHFTEIGERLGPFDMAFMECGQYNELWRPIHMMPEESVAAALDVKAGMAIPVHWGAFTLSLHKWQDPAEHFAMAAEQKGLDASFPRLGVIYGIPSKNAEHWWEKL